MTLDEQLVQEARAANERLIDLRHEQELAQADLHHFIRKLHAKGGSLREIAEELGVSHQRVHQIVGAEPERRGPSRPHRRAFRGGMVQFTRFARDAVEAATRAAEEYGHGQVGTEHLLLGLTLVEGGGAAAVLHAAGVDALRVREHVAAAGSPGKHRRLPFTRRTKRAMEEAFAEALRLKSRRIGTEHLLLALLADPQNGASGILDALGADREELRRLTLERLDA